MVYKWFKYIAGLKVSKKDRINVKALILDPKKVYN